MCSLSVEHLSFSKCIRKANGLRMPVKKQGSLTIIYQFGYLDKLKYEIQCLQINLNCSTVFYVV